MIDRGASEQDPWPTDRHCDWASDYRPGHGVEAHTAGVQAHRTGIFRSDIDALLDDVRNDLANRSAELGDNPKMIFLDPFCCYWRGQLDLLETMAEAL